MFLRGGMYDVFKAGAYLNDIPHTFSSNAFSPYGGIGGNLLTATFPLGVLPNPSPPGNWSNFTLGYDRRDWGGFAEWQRNSPWYFRVDGNQVSVQRNQGRLRGERHEPGQRLRRSRVPDPVHDRQLGRRRRLPVGQGDASPRAGTTASSTTTTRRSSGRTRTSAATSSTRRTCRRATRSTSSRCPATTATCRGGRSCPRATPGRRRRATSRSGRPRSTPAPSFPPTLPQRQQLQRREHQPVVRAVVDRGAGHQRRHPRVLLLDQAREQLDDRRVRQRARRSRSPTAWAAATHPGDRPADADRPATARTSSTTTPRTTSASTSGGSSCAATGWASAGTTTTSTRRASTTTRRTGTNSGSSTRTRCSTRCRAGSSTSTSSATRRPTSATPGSRPNDPNYLLRYTTAFDLQSNTTNLLKLYLDWNPLPAVGVSFEGVWSKIDYDDAVLGRTARRPPGLLPERQLERDREVEAQRLSAAGRKYKYPSNHRNINTVAGGPTPPSGFCTTANPNCYDPFAPPYPASPGSGTASYNWNSQTKDKTWMVGVGADWQAMEKLKLSASYLYVENKGDAHLRVPERRRAQQPARAQHRQLRQQQAAVLQPEGNLGLQQELVVHRRLLVHEVQPQRHRDRRLPVHPAVSRAHRRPARA